MKIDKDDVGSTSDDIGSKIGPTSSCKAKSYRFESTEFASVTTDDFGCSSVRGVMYIIHLI